MSTKKLIKALGLIIVVALLAAALPLQAKAQTGGNTLYVAEWEDPIPLANVTGRENVLKDGDTYHMWYSPSDTAIYHTSSTDPDSFTPAASACTFSDGTPAEVGSVSVVKEGETFYMIAYEKSGSENPNKKFAIYTSDDGDEWAYGGVVFDGIAAGITNLQKIDGPYLIKIGDTYRLYFQLGSGDTYASRTYDIFVAESASITGQYTLRADPVLTNGAAGAWDGGNVMQPWVVEDNGVFYMWYSGWGTGFSQQVGMAKSTDGLTWVKSPGNPIVVPATGYAEPSVIKDGNTWRMWTMGTGGVINYLTATGPFEFQSIQAAVTGASAGDTINVAPGTYDEENILITKGLTLQGAGAVNTFIAPSTITNNSTIIVQNPTGNVRIDGFNFVMQPKVNYGSAVLVTGETIDIDSATVTISNNVVTGSDNGAKSDYGFYGQGNNAKIVITGNTINKTGDNPIVMEQQFGSSTVENNTFYITASPDYDAYYSMVHSGKTISTPQIVQNNVFHLNHGDSGYSQAISFTTAVLNAWGGQPNDTGHYTDIQIKNNTIYTDGPSARGIGLIDRSSALGNGTITGAVVTGNKIIGEAATDAETYGITLVGDIRGVVIQNNEISNVNLGFIVRKNLDSGATLICSSGTDFSLNKVTSVTIAAQNIDCTDVTVDASPNWWGSTAGPAEGAVVGSVKINPWCYNEACTELFVAEGGSIQDAIDAAPEGGMVRVAPGTYNEQVIINKQVSIVGAGKDGANPTIITSTANRTVLLGASGTEASPILLKDLQIQGSSGIYTTFTPIDYVTLESVWLNANPVKSGEGFRLATGHQMTHLTITNSIIEGYIDGIIVEKTPGAGDEGTKLQYVTMTNTIIKNNYRKGMYVETLSDAIFTDVQLLNNGYVTPGSNLAEYHSAGFDINLKDGNYSNLQFINMTAIGNGLTSKEGAALMIKARDDGATYGAYPATLSNVHITGGTFTGNERGIRFGEPGTTNAGPTNVVITGAAIHSNFKTYGGDDGSAYGDVVNFSLAQVVASPNWWESVAGPAAGAIVGDVTYAPWCGDAACDTLMPDEDGVVDLTPPLDEDPPAPEEIQNAINNAPSGSTIVIPEGVYAHEGAFEISTPNLTIKLSDGTVIQNSSPCFTLDADNITITSETIGRAKCVPTDGDHGIVVNDGVSGVRIVGIEIDGSDLTGSGDGIYFAGSVNGVHLVSNNIHDLDGDAITFATAPTGSVTIAFNRFYNNDSGINILDSAGTGAESMSDSLIAENNWWGCNEGPGDIRCDSASQIVDYDPWLVLKITSEKQIVKPDEEIQIDANLIYNSAGQNTLSDGYVPNGITAEFSVQPPGSVDPVSTETVQGQVSTSFTPTEGGVFNVCVTVDNQTECTEDIVIPAAAAVDDEYRMMFNSTLDVGFAEGVTKNDTGITEDFGYTVSLVSAPLHGQLELKADGSFKYIPEANFVGDDSFVYQLVIYPSKPAPANGNPNPWLDQAMVKISVEAYKIFIPLIQK